MIKEVKKELNEDISDSIAVILSKEAWAKRSPQKMASLIANSISKMILKSEKDGVEMKPVVGYLQTELKYLLKNI